MKKTFVFITIFSFFILFTTCSSFEGDASKGGGYPGSPSHDDGGYSSSEDSDSDNKHDKPAAGQLTCGEWSDIKNYDFYLNLFRVNEQEVPENQQRKNYSQFIGYFGFETRYMITVNVVNNNLPVFDAVVELYDSEQNKLFTAKTDKRGSAYLFPENNLEGENITIKAISGSYEILRQLIYNKEVIQAPLSGQAAEQSILDLMFVIDTTGSMGDELNYLKSEISDVIGKISNNTPNFTINLALLFYRDIGDDYVTRYFDFSTNISLQQKNLSKQSANGGEDFPEASDKALEEAIGKDWKTNSTRIMFHVCDAPPHNNQENKTRYFNAVRTAAQKGIRIIPIASSGIDYDTEFLLRQEALMTGGTYIFLTDDSGIGENHLEPVVGEYTVEYLNDCMVRVVNEYLTGVETKPVPYYQQ